MLIYHRHNPTGSPTVISDDEHSTSQMSSSSNTSVAASIITAAAERIGDIDPQELLQKLESERIREDWQLEYLDSLQWQMLGVPMGLVASIRRCLVERKHDELDALSSSPLQEFAARKKTIIPSQLAARLAPLEEIPHSSSPTRSQCSVHSMLSLPPVMPTRKESQADATSKMDLSDMDTIQEHACYHPDSVPPALPKRLQSLEYSDLQY